MAKKLKTPGPDSGGMEEETSDNLFDLCQFLDKDGNVIEMPDFKNAGPRFDDEVGVEELEDESEDEMSFDDFKAAFHNPEDIEIRDLGEAG